jgi:MFS superfamily sulfate permease-like transporter
MVLLKPWVSQVPVAALVAIMVMVSASTFDWGSLRALVRHPRMSSAVMLSGVFFTFKVARLLHVHAAQDADNARIYRVTGQVFFASADMLGDAFDVREIDRSGARRSSGRRAFPRTSLRAKASGAFAHHAPEGSAERRLRLVADALGNARNGLVTVAQRIARHRHAPAAQVVERR